MEEKVLIKKNLLEKIIEQNIEILGVLKENENIDINKYEKINYKIEDVIKKENNIQHFKNIFEIPNIKINTDRLPLLKYIFREFGEDLFTPSEKNKQLRSQKIKIGKELDKTLTEEQREKITQYRNLENQITEEQDEQLFMFGFIIAQELREEMLKVKEDNGLLE